MAFAHGDPPFLEDSSGEGKPKKAKEVIKLVGNPANELVIEMHVLGLARKVTILVDTGASVNLLKESSFGEFKGSLMLELRKPTCIIKNISEDEIPTRGIVSVPLQVSSQPRNAESLVVPDREVEFKGDFLLGIQFFRENELDLAVEFTKRMVRIGKEKFRMLPKSSRPMTSGEKVRVVRGRERDEFGPEVSSPTPRELTTKESSRYPGIAVSTPDGKGTRNRERSARTYEQPLIVKDGSEEKPTGTDPEEALDSGNRTTSEKGLRKKGEVTSPTKKRPSRDKFRLYIDENRELGPLEKAVLKGHIVDSGRCDSFEGKAFVIFGNYLETGMMVANMLVTIKGGKCPVEVINVSERPIRIKPTELAVSVKGVKSSMSQSRKTEKETSRAVLGESRETIRVVKTQLNREEIKERYRECLKDNIARSPILQHPKEGEKLIKLLIKNRGVVALQGDHLGKTTLCEFEIKLEDPKRVVSQGPYRVPHSQQAIIDDHVRDMLSQGVIRPSLSPFSSPVLLVPKADGTKRFVADFRKLNMNTVSDRHPIPDIRQTLLSLGGAAIFTTLDLLSGYWQLPLAESSKKYTAFSTYSGHYEFNSLPFGLKNAPSAFCRLMKLVLSDVLQQGVLVYLDDIIIYTSDVSTHLARLQQVFDKLKEANLKVKLSKCRFMMDKLIYLGHSVSQKGIAPDPRKTEILEKYPVPRSIDEVRSFIGFTNFYRNFIPKYSHIATPLTGLLRKGAKFEWENEQQAAFDSLRKRLISEPIMIHPDFKKEFIVATDASNHALGAVLLQEHEGIELPIAYASKVMTKAERNYSVTEKEALAVVFGLKQFKKIIYGYEITVKTDHSSLVYLFQNKLLEGRLSRWSLLVQDFCAKIVYKPGKDHVIADALSRIRMDEGNPEQGQVGARRENSKDEEELEMEKVIRRIRSLPTIDEETLRAEQRKDARIQGILKRISEESNPKYEIKDEILYRKSEAGTLVYELPSSLIDIAIGLCHDQRAFAHGGAERTLINCKKRYHYPHLSRLVREYVASCDSCNRHKTPTHLGKAKIHRYPASLLPWQRTSMDFLGSFPLTKRGNRYIIVFVDFMTRYVELEAIPRQTAERAARSLLNCVIKNHTTPEVLISDRGGAFTSDIFRELSKLCGINKVFTTAYHPASNGLCERANRRVLDALRHIVRSDQKNWDECLVIAQMALNNSYNCTVGDTPSFLLRHYDPRLPADLVNPPPQNEVGNEFNRNLSERSFKIFELIRKHMIIYNQTEEFRMKGRKETLRDKFQVGSRCFIKSVRPPGVNRKLYKKWSGPFRIMKDLGRNRYEICDLKTLKTKIYHADNLKSIPEGNVSRRVIPNARTPFPQIPVRDSETRPELDPLSDISSDGNCSQEEREEEQGTPSPHYNLRSHGADS